MPEGREGELKRLLETEARLEAMLAAVRKENEARLGKARREAELVLEALEADLPAFHASVRESIGAEFDDAIRTVEARAAEECHRYDAVAEEEIHELAKFVIGKLIGEAGVRSS